MPIIKIAKSEMQGEITIITHVNPRKFPFNNENNKTEIDITALRKLTITVLEVLETSKDRKTKKTKCDYEKKKHIHTKQLK
jgi:hypothetical protein